MPDKPRQRETWQGKLGFLFAATGSAIGLGNIWRFPTMAGESGGAAFVVLYLAAVALIGIPVMLAELTVGWQTRLSPERAIQKLAPGTLWKVLGGVAILASLAIVSYYSVVASWTLAYVWEIVRGAFAEIPDGRYVELHFEGLTASPSWCVGSLALFVMLTCSVVWGGVQAGIERWSKVLMPLLLALLLILLVRSLTLPGAASGLHFYLAPDFSKVTSQTVLNALSQAFFSLSLGMGIMITYGSYLDRNANLASSTCWICAADTAIALLAGLIIFPALFTIPGLEPAQGQKLIFLVLPNLFDKIPGGIWFGAGFFALLTLAALTSAVSLSEVVVSSIMDRWHWSRQRAVCLVGLLILALGLPSALSGGAVSWLTKLPGLDISFMAWMDFALGKVCLAGSSLALCLFVGWRWGVGRALAGLNYGRRFATGWSLLLRFVCPLLIAAILLSLFL